MYSKWGYMYLYIIGTSSTSDLDMCYCDWQKYNWASCPDKAEECDSRTCGTVTRYKITSCVDGMVLSGDSCICKMPDGYAPSNYVDCSSPNICASIPCPDGSKSYYRVVGCESGYTYSDFMYGSCR